jgi:hypothetical protein
MHAYPPSTPPADPPVASLRTAFLSILPRIERHGRVYFRGINCAHRQEEAVAEMVALCWDWYVRLARRGKDAGAFTSALATYAARAVGAGRRLCGQESAKDALSPAAQRRHAFAVQALPASDGGDGDDLALDALRDNTVTAPPDQAAFRLDFPAWRATYGVRDRGIINDLMAGERAGAVARKYGVTPGRVSQKRRQFRRDWHDFGEPAAASASA